MLARSLRAAILAILVACAVAQAAPAAGGAQACLRDSRNRYTPPASAVDDQYSDAAGSCASDDVRVTVSGTDGGGPSAGGGPRGPGAPGAQAPAGGSATTGTTPPGSGTAPSGSGNAAPPAAARAPERSAAASVDRALARADAGSVAAAPAAWSHAPRWLLVLGGGLVLVIGGAVAVRVLRPGR